VRWCWARALAQQVEARSGCPAAPPLGRAPRCARSQSRCRAPASLRARRGRLWNGGGGAGRAGGGEQGPGAAEERFCGGEAGPGPCVEREAVCGAGGAAARAESVGRAVRARGLGVRGRSGAGAGCGVGVSVAAWVRGWTGARGAGWERGGAVGGL